jgi:hypothetical protein
MPRSPGETGGHVVRDGDGANFEEFDPWLQAEAAHLHVVGSPAWLPEGLRESGSVRAGERREAHEDAPAVLMRTRPSALRTSMACRDGFALSVGAEAVEVDLLGAALCLPPAAAVLEVCPPVSSSGASTEITRPRAG